MAEKNPWVTRSIPDAEKRGPGPDAPLAIKVRGVEKEFRFPETSPSTLKERVLHPLRKAPVRELRALGGIDFDVRRGEFFGIAGRNGSGKSTLLKILASTYRADAGRIWMAGRAAPFIELGVGFNPDLTGRENVVLNAVMMGLTPAQARRQVGAVFRFAELEDFRELKLKNYSSGMVVRLAFSVMLQVDADIMLIDEVLAVGDASFQRKCNDVFAEMRDSGKTVVLVTHDMGAIQTYCHRAMLIESGEMVHLGEPEEVARRYFQLNLGSDEPQLPSESPAYAVDVHARVVEASLADSTGKQVETVVQGEPLRLRVLLEATDELARPRFAIHCSNVDGVHVFGLRRELESVGGEIGRLGTGERIEIEGEISNRLAPGRYYISCWVYRDRPEGDSAVQAFGVLEFVVEGSEEIRGIITVDSDLQVAPVGREASR